MGRANVLGVLGQYVEKFSVHGMCVCARHPVKGCEAACREIFKGMVEKHEESCGDGLGVCI